MIHEIINAIQIHKPENSLSTTNQHARTILALYQKLWPTETTFNESLITNASTDELLSAISPNSGVDNRKRYACALVIFTRRPELSDIITQANVAYHERINAHISTESEIKNRLTPDDIQIIDDRLYDDYFFNRGDYDAIKRYTLWCLVSGKFIPPRRSLDWIALKVRHVDKDVDNYLDNENNMLIFQQYKTKKIYGTDFVKCPTILADLIMECAMYNESDYLFFNKDGDRLANSSFCKLVNKLSDSVVGHGTNQYRKAFLQRNFGNIMDLNETMRKMGSSSANANSYIKEVK